jgi:hypothetical protein
MINNMINTQRVFWPQYNTPKNWNARPAAGEGLNWPAAGKSENLAPAGTRFHDNEQ